MAEARKYLQKFMGFFWEGVRCGASQVLLVVKNLPANTGDTEMQVRSLVREDSLEEEMAKQQSTPVFLPGEPHVQSS